MKDITYNVKNDATILNSLNNFEPWALFDRLGKSITDGYGVTSPQMLNQTHCKLPRDTYDLYKYRKSGKIPTFKASPRRGYTAITFTF